MTDNIKLFLENNAHLLDKDVELFIGHAYEQLLNSEQEELMSVLESATIDITEEITAFQKAFIRKNMYMYEGALLTDFLADVPRFDKTIEEIKKFVTELAPDIGFDITVT